MAYSDFTLEDLEEKHGLVTRIKPFFSNIQTIQPSDLLLQQLSFSEHFPLRSEKIKSELLVIPVLGFIKIKNESFVQLFSGENLPANKKEKLNGEVDFLWVGNQMLLNYKNLLSAFVKPKKGQ